jgi:hypothetical protein
MIEVLSVLIAIAIIGIAFYTRYAADLPVKMNKNKSKRP